MPTVEDNHSTWNEEYDWAQEGDEWSSGWGGADAQWFGALFPRVRHYLPASTIVEIAPGHGRWTNYLADHCDRLIGVDLSSACVDVCRERFAEQSNLEFFVNDGRSLVMVEDSSADLVFSFDSLVHAEAEVISAYLEEIATKLAPMGVAFLHHSNGGEHLDLFAGWNELPVEEVHEMEQARERPPRHWRAMSMTAAKMRDYAGDVGLECVGQEIVNWGGDVLIDCISVLALPGAQPRAETVIVRNVNFTAEMQSIRATSMVYGQQA